MCAQTSRGATSILFRIIGNNVFFDVAFFFVCCDLILYWSGEHQTTERTRESGRRRSRRRTLVEDGLNCKEPFLSYFTLPSFSYFKAGENVTGANPVVTLYLLSLGAFVILEDIRPIVLFCSSRTHPRCNMQYIHMMHVQCCL